MSAFSKGERLYEDSSEQKSRDMRKSACWDEKDMRKQ